MIGAINNAVNYVLEGIFGPGEDRTYELRRAVAETIQVHDRIAEKREGIIHTDFRALAESLVNLYDTANRTLYDERLGEQDRDFAAEQRSAAEKGLEIIVLKSGELFRKDSFRQLKLKHELKEFQHMLGREYGLPGEEMSPTEKAAAEKAKEKIQLVGQEIAGHEDNVRYIFREIHRLEQGYRGGNLQTRIDDGFMEREVYEFLHGMPNR